MPTIELTMQYDFSYEINEKSIIDEKKDLLRARLCQDIYLQRIFDNLPGFFDKSIAWSKDYFINDRPNTTPTEIAANELKPEHNTKVIFSCIAKHLCSRVFPLGETAIGYTGDNKDYGVDANIKDALEQMSILTATKRWLDLWASYFGIGRNAGESDEALRTRIITILNQPKNTLPIIKESVRNYLGYDPDIYELAETGIHNPPDSPDAPAAVSPEFEHGGVKDIQRRAARIVIEVKSEEPPPGSMFVSRPTKLTAQLWPDEWFVTDTTGMVSGDARRRCESYIDTAIDANLGNGATLFGLVSVVNEVKPGGLKVYYRVSGQYMLI